MLVGVKWYVTVVLICVFLVTVLRICVCMRLLAIHVFSLEKCLQIFYPFLEIGLCVFVVTHFCK